MTELKRWIFPVLALALSSFLLAGCDKIPGKPEPEEAYQRPTEVTDFNVLYTTYCAGCHSLDASKPAAARQLNEALYLAFAGREAILQITEDGVPGTTMPAGLIDKGGKLTEEQVGIIVDGIVERTPPLSQEVTDLPPYRAELGRIEEGREAFSRYCAGCHGEDGSGGPKAGSIVDPAYLELVTNQSLRTTVVAGRTDLGMPDFRNMVPGEVMSDEEVEDVVAWLASHREEPDNPAQGNEERND